MTAKRIPVSTIALLLLSATFAATAQTNKHPDSEKTRPPRSQDPANYIEVIEESGNNRILHYYPDGFHDYLRSRQFKVDAGSTLLLRIVPERLDPNAALSNLLITAQLKHGSTSTNVEVVNYSVIGKSQTAGQSQNAVNLNSIANVRAQMENLYITSHQILEDVMPACLQEIERTGAPYFDKQVPAQCQTSQVASSDGTAPGLSQATLKSLTAELTLFTPEINSLAALFTDPQNAFLGTYFSNLLFGMDLNSVKAVATEFQQAMATQTKQATANQTTANAGGVAAKSMIDPSLWPRVVMIYEDLWTSINAADQERGDEALMKSLPILPTDTTTQAKAEDYFLNELTKKLVERLKEYLVDGQIVLADYKPAAGDVLEITIEAQTPTSGNASSGSIVHFGITIDNFGVNAGPSTSLFFLKRIAVSAGDLNLPTPITPVTFAPAPGGSFGFTYHYRKYGKCDEPDRVTSDADIYPQPPAGPDPHLVEHVCSGNSTAGTAGGTSNAQTAGFDSYKDRHPNFMREPSGGGGKFLRALAPGFGLNVSFMNWSVPTDYDTTTGKFATTTSTNVQIGTGFVVSLFDNMAQFTYGWNLQVTTRREYWGLGFGFLEVGKTLAGLLKSKTTTPSQ